MSLHPERPPYVKGSDTSKEAADSMIPHVGTLRALVLDRVRKAGKHGITCDALEEELRLTHQTCSARVNELHNGKLIIDSGQRRATRSRRKAVVYIDIKERAHDVP